MGDKLLNQDSLYKNQEEFEIKTSYAEKVMVENPYVITESLNIEQYMEKSHEDILKREEAKPGMLDAFIKNKTELSNPVYRPGTFDHLVSTRQEDKLLDKAAKKQLKQKQEKMVEELDHTEKEDFNLLSRLENNPFKIYDWMKANAVVKGASKSFKKLIDAYGKMLNAPEEALKTAGMMVAEAAGEYLNSHSSKPSHNYGKQRVIICKDILENIGATTTLIAWQRQLLIDPAGDVKAGPSNLKEKEIKRILDARSNDTEGQEEILKEILKEGFTEEEMIVAKDETRNIIPVLKNGDKEWNKEWIRTYLRQKTLMKNKNLSSEEEKELEAIKHQRKPLLDSVVNEMMSLTEEDINRILTEPEFYLLNYAKLQRLGAITYLNDSKGQNPFDKEYFDNMPEGYKKKYEAICNTFFLAMDTVRQALVEGAGVSGSNLNIKREERKLNNYNENYKNVEKFKSEAFGYKGVESLKENWDKAEDDAKGAQYKNASLEYLEVRFAKGSQKRARKEAESTYKNINAVVNKYKKDGILCAPSLEEARNIMHKGSLEERFALLLLFERLDVISVKVTDKNNNYGLSREYESFFYALSESLLNTHEDPNAQSDMMGLNMEDSKKLGVIMASYHQMAIENLYGSMDKDIQKLNKSYTPDMTKEVYEKKKAEIISGYMNSQDAQLMGAMEQYGSQDGSDSLASYVYRASRYYYGDMMSFAKSNMLEHTYKSAHYAAGDMSDADYDKAIARGQEMGFIGKEEDAQRKYVNRAQETRVEPTFVYRDAEAYHIAFNEDKKDSLLKSNEVNATITRNKKKDDAAKKKANKLMSEKLGKDAPKFKVATRFTEDSMGVATELSKTGKTLRNYTKRVSEHATDKAHNFVLYYLRTETDITEDMTDKEKGKLTAIHEWNESFMNNYEKAMDGNEVAGEKLLNQMFERLDEIMRFEITKENLQDINWVIKNLPKLEELTNICGNLSNIEHGQSKLPEKLEQEYLRRIKDLPHHDLLDAKMVTIGDMNGLLQFVRGGIGLKATQGLADPTEYFMNEEDESYLDEGSAGMGVSFEEGYNQSIQNVLYSYDKYAKARDKYIKPTK